MIVGVAAKLSDGRILSLPKPARHSNLFREYNIKGRAEGWPFPWEGWDGDLIRKAEQGFVDENGKFLSRAEAAEHALQAGQISAPKRHLFSEDVW